MNVELNLSASSVALHQFLDNQFLSASLPPDFFDFMTDPRLTRLAKLLVEYSTGLKPGDRVLLDMIDVPDEFSIELIRVARAAGAIPIVEVRHTRITRELLRDTDQHHATLVRDLELAR